MIDNNYESMRKERLCDSVTEYLDDNEDFLVFLSDLNSILEDWKSYHSKMVERIEYITNRLGE